MNKNARSFRGLSQMMNRPQTLINKEFPPRLRTDENCDEPSHNRERFVRGPGLQ
jgi:hypothetical protein